MRKTKTGPCLTVLFLGLSGCMGHGGSIRYDTAVRNAPGTIAVSDPKLYSRENLLNERARDVAWIDGLIVASEDPTKVVFKPGLYREMEEISAFSAALGLKFDPAAALSYRRANATADLQQEIDVLKLQTQLDQLRRDAQLMRDKLPLQTEPVNQGLGTLGTATPPATPDAVTPGDVSKLTTAINDLMTGLTKRLDADGKPVGKTDIASSPAEDFRDRLAYRDLLKAARNSAGLDELHDLASNRLIRLNFQATVFPDRINSKALAAVQVKVADPGGANRSAYLLDWLRSVNTQPENRTGSTTTLDAMAESGDFELVPFSKDALVLLPVMYDGAVRSPLFLQRRAFWNLPETQPDGKGDRQENQRRLGLLNSEVPGAREAALAALCGPGGDASDLGVELDTAEARLASYSLIKTVNQIYLDLGFAAPAIAVDAKRQRAVDFRGALLHRLGGRTGCDGIMARLADRPEPSWMVLQRPEFATIQQVRVYEVGPREQAEQVSTLARSANSLALAASIAASDPSSGIGGELGAAYRRDTMNRASALERMPEVVGYSLAGQGTFGWVIGPRATTDTHGRAELMQLLKPYDLSVDLSVPSWWSYLDLELTTLWAPSSRDLVDGTLKVDHRGGPGGDPRPITVTLPAVPADFRAFTQVLLKDTARAVKLDQVVGGPVNACTPATILLTGDNIWRAQRVMVMGLTLDRGAFSISPDMKGILVTVPAIPAIPGEMAYKQDPLIHVLTPLGPGQRPFAYEASPTGDACKPSKAADPNAVTVKPLVNDEVFVPNLVSFRIEGTNFAAVDAVTLGDQPGEIVQRNSDGTVLRVEFKKERTGAISLPKVKLQLYSKDKPVGTALDVRITRK